MLGNKMPVKQQRKRRRLYRGGSHPFAAMRPYIEKLARDKPHLFARPVHDAFLQRGGSIQYYRGLPEQYGSGMLYFAGVPEQYGNGLGNILGSLFRRIVPAFKRFVLPAVKNVASSYIKSAAQNLNDGRSLGASLKESLKDAGQQTLSEVGGIANAVMNARRQKAEAEAAAALEQADTVKVGSGLYRRLVTKKMKKKKGKQHGGGRKKRVRKQRGRGKAKTKSKNAYKRRGKSQSTTLNAFLRKIRTIDHKL